METLYSLGINAHVISCPPGKAKTRKGKIPLSGALYAVVALSMVDARMLGVRSEPYHTTPREEKGKEMMDVHALSQMMEEQGENFDREYLLEFLMDEIMGSDFIAEALPDAVYAIEAFNRYVDRDNTQ